MTTMATINIVRSVLFISKYAMTPKEQVRHEQAGSETMVRDQA
jgi:hypothetical protein